MKGQLKQCIDDNDKLKHEMSALTKKYTAISAELREQKLKLNAGEQEKINSNVLIRGVNGEENALTVVSNIAEIAEIQLNEGDVLSARQIHSQKKDPCVLVQFAMGDKKRDFVKASKTKKINTQMYGYDGDMKPIYVDEQLTSESFQLFKRTKNLKKFGVKFVWISNGNILVRESPNSAVINIKSMEQVKDIEYTIMAKDEQTKNDAKKKKKTTGKKESATTNDKGTESTETTSTNIVAIAHTKHTNENANNENRDKEARMAANENSKSSTRTHTNSSESTRSRLTKKTKTNNERESGNEKCVTRTSTKQNKSDNSRWNVATHNHKPNSMQKQPAITLSDDEFVDA